MLQIVSCVLALALLSLMLVAGLNYIDVDAITRMQARQTVSAAQTTIKRAVDAYRVANGGAAPTASADGSFPTGDLAPFLAAPPAAPPGMAWSYELANGIGYACLSGSNVSKPVFDGLQQVTPLTGQTIVGHDCDDQTSSTTYTGAAAFIIQVY